MGAAAHVFQEEIAEKKMSHKQLEIFFGEETPKILS